MRSARPLSALGWDTDLKEYRPFLSHAELEAFFGKQSELHDLLASVLGLEDLANADKRLNAARKVREDELSNVKKRLEALRARMQPIAGQDERAQACLTALSGNTPIQVGRPGGRGRGHRCAVADGGALAALRGIAQLTPPRAEEVEATIADARSAAKGLRDVAGTNAAQARELVALLDAALGHYHAHGDGDCPVCGNPGALTAAWRAATEQNRDRLRGEAVAANDAFEKARAAARRVVALLSSPPVVLAADRQVPAVDVAPARQAWSAWIAPVAGRVEASDTTPESLTSLAQHLEAEFPALVAAVTVVATAAAEELASRDDQWAPIAADVAAWCADAAKAVFGRDSRSVTSRSRASGWRTPVDDLRDRRLAPLAEQSRAIWADLRQESNVDLGAFRLMGANTTRRLDLDVSVDGSPGAALGVMSQGEINALALSIFLPRATMPDSPFNFLVIDDPVQAMDPAKVDGLAKVLDKVARRRQVVVFTHDNRLASAIKDLGIPATILEVTRQPKSQVTVRECLDASSQAIKDARALSKDQDIPLEVAERVIPGLCRTAVEASFTSAYWRAALRNGRNRTDIEESLEPNGKRVNLRGIAQLALFGEATDASVPGYLNKQWGSGHANTYQALNKGAHDRLRRRPRWPDRGHQSPRPQDLGEAALTPAELLAEARSLISRPDASMAGVWPRTAAFLARQALEDAVDASWAASSATAPMLQASMWSRLACLPAYVSAPEARQVTFAYAALSRACHYHPYELAPTAAELTGWIADVETLVAELGQAAPLT